MAKITIYVPDGLKAEMDAFEKLEPNWSSMAQDAFRAECARLNNRKRNKGKMDAVIKRLRQSKEKLANEDSIEGHRAGREWASEQAEYDQLKRVAAWDPPGGEWNAPHGEAGWLYEQIEDDGIPDTQSVIEFWKDVAGVEEPSDEFLRAFVEGAAEVWSEVSDKL